jgi:hypothetical protein
MIASWIAIVARTADDKATFDRHPNRKNDRRSDIELGRMARSVRRAIERLRTTASQTTIASATAR